MIPPKRPFAEPWQAQVFALTLQLHAKGAFTWPEWASALAEELTAAEAMGEPDDGTRYYQHWVTALERLVTRSGLATQEALACRKADWEAAYRDTPHGHPIVLPDRTVLR